MAREILLIRHGQSTFNAHFEATGRDPGHVDAPLTALGHAQAVAARAVVAGLGQPDLVIASPLTRAIQTALGIFGESGVPVEVTCRHREFLEHSCDIGRSPAALAAAFPQLSFGHLDDPWWHDGPRDGNGVPVEPEALWPGRVAAFADWLAAHAAERVAVIGHGAFFRHLTGRPFANCEVVRWAPG